MGVSKKVSMAIAMLFSLGLFAQQDLVWYFGTQSSNGVEIGQGLKFDGSTNTPEVLNSGAPFKIYESISVVSDCEGEVLFYSDGMKVYDADHQEMPNGSGLLGSKEDGSLTDAGGSSLNGSIIVSDPSSVSKYFIFSVGEIDQAANNGWRYSEVDLSLSGNGDVSNPKGDVSANKNILIQPGIVTEGMTVTSNECGDSLWIVTHSFNGDTLFALPITASGGVGTPVWSTIGPGFSGGSTLNRRGSMDFSPDGSKLAISYIWPIGGHIFDFDFNTGLFSNHVNITQLSQGAHGVEFSFDGEKVFFGRGPWGDIKRYNVVTGDFSDVGVVGTDVGDLERAPDGRIYVGKYNGNSLGVINNPDAADGVTIDYVNNGITFPGTVALGLPQMVIKPGNKLITADISVPFDLTDVCDKGGVLELTAQPACGTWEGGAYISADGDFDPSGLIEGNYQVRYNRGECYINDTIDFNVEDCCPPLQVRDSILCEGSEAFNIGVLVDSGIGIWSLESVPNGTGSAATLNDSIFDASNYKLDSAYVTDGNYQLEYTYWNAPLPECPDSAVSVIEIDSFPRDIFLGVNNSLIQECGTEYTFVAKSGLEYNWAAPISTTSNPQTVSVGGEYFLTVNSPSENCLTMDSVEVEFDQTPTAEIEVRDTIVCGAGAIMIGVNQPGLLYTWEGGGVAMEDSLLITQAGEYRVEILTGLGGFCPKRDTVDVELAPPFEVNFVDLGDTLTMCPATDDTLLVGPSDFTVYNWTGPVDDYNGTDSMRLLTDFSDGEYIALEVFDEFGCNGSDTLHLVRFCDIQDPFIPNIIVPDGTTNTTFIPIDFPPGTEGVYNALYPTSNLVIFDRWGLKMFEDSDYPNWDGTNPKGNNVPGGVYYWTLELKDANGKSKTLNGFVQVVR